MRASAGHAGPQGKAPVSVRRHKITAREKPVPEPLLGLSQKRQGRENNLGLATLNNSCWFWARRVVSGCLVPGLRMISGRGSISV